MRYFLSSNALARAQIFRGELGRAPGSAAEAAAAAELIVFTRDERVLRALQTTMGAIDAEQVCAPCSFVRFLYLMHCVCLTCHCVRVSIVCASFSSFTAFDTDSVFDVIFESFSSQFFNK
jgi:hypothetical protein